MPEPIKGSSIHIFWLMLVLVVSASVFILLASLSGSMTVAYALLF